MLWIKYARIKKSSFQPPFKNTKSSSIPNMLRKTSREAAQQQKKHDGRDYLYYMQGWQVDFSLKT